MRGPMTVPMPDLEESADYVVSQFTLQKLLGHRAIRLGVTQTHCNPDLRNQDGSNLEDLTRSGHEKLFDLLGQS